MVGDTMNDEDMKREHLSALADGELQGQEFADAVGYACTHDGQSAWRMYHLIGDTLRSAQVAYVAHVADPALIGRLRQQLALEPQPGAMTAAPASAVAAGPARVASPAREAANASVFRWKLAAGFASLAAVVAVGWSAYGLGGAGAPQGASQGAQLAAAQPSTPVQGFVATANAPQGPQEQQVMIRDPRLDALLAEQQYGKTTALQMPMDFLRNATFDASKR